MIDRNMQSHLLEAAKGYPALALLGPRQSGKTTLAQTTFPKHKYISLENFDQRAFAIEEPRRFLQLLENEYGIILDEIQHTPQLLSYIQTEIDAHDRPGYFILTGSQNFTIQGSISQSLAGRIALFTLLPLSNRELDQAKLLPDQAQQLVFQGGYPRTYNKKINPANWYDNYIQTYLEQDVRQITQVSNLMTFNRFLKLCAGRTGQILNLSSLATDCGISHTTANAWLSILEASYIVFLLQPYHKNFNKRLIKSPKLYFYDTGLACALLGIDSVEQLSTHYLYGGLFESMVISEIIKECFNQNRRPHVYFWRDSHGHEVDCIIEKGIDLRPIEIKSGQTINSGFFTGLKWWNELTKSQPEDSFLVYGGLEEQARSNGKVRSWRNLSDLIR